MRRSPGRLKIWEAMALVALAAGGLWLASYYNQVRAEAERQGCQNVLSNFALDVVAYQNATGSFPPGTLPGSTLPPEQRVSWVPLILSWTDYYQNILFLFDRDRPWDSPENRLPRIQTLSDDNSEMIVPSTSPPRFPLRCPSNHSKVGPGMPGPLHYVGIAGLGTDAPSLPAGHPRAGVFGYDRRTRLAEITDGASTTMMLAETTMANGPWTAGGPATVRGLDPGRPPYIGPGGQFGGAHPGGAMVAFADGTVRFLRQTVDPKAFEAMSTIAGGETLSQGWDR